MTQNEIEQNYKAQKLELELKNKEEREKIILSFQEKKEALHESFMLDVRCYKETGERLRKRLSNAKIELAKNKLQLNDHEYSLKEIEFFEKKSELEAKIAENQLSYQLMTERNNFQRIKLNENKNLELSNLNIKYSVKLQELKDKMFEEIENNRKLFKETEENF